MLFLYCGFIFLLINLYRCFFYSFKRIRTFEKTDLLDKDYSRDRYTKRKIPKQIDTIIIGSGIGSLTTAGLLSKFGRKVLVLEQHYIAGGTTHSFEDKGVEHETGLHYIGNIKKRKPILDLISFNPIDWCKLGWERNDGRYIYDEIFIGNRCYEFEAGEENIINYLVDCFPDTKRESFEEYFNLVKKVAKKDMFFLSKIIPSKYIGKIISSFDKDYEYYCKTSAYEVVSKIFKDENLISVLFGQFGDYGLTPKKASFFIHASIVNHYLDGGWYPRGGTGTIAQEICKTINYNGGRVLVGKKVDEILINNNEVYGLRMENNDILYCKNVVSGVGLANTFKKLVKIEQNNIYTELLKKIPSSVQHMYAFVKLQGNPDELNLRSSNFWIYPHGDYDKVIKDFIEDPLNKPIPLFMAFSSMKDDSWKERFPGYSNAIILTVAKKEWFKFWENEKCMKRSDDYNNLKKTIGDRMLKEGLLRFYPELEDKILDISYGTPLTTQFYLNSIDGESYGLDMNFHRLTDSFDLRPKTNIKGLYLTGQDICTLGVTGAMMGGVLTANVIAGYGNYLDILMGNNIIKDLYKVESLNKKTV